VGKFTHSGPDWIDVESLLRAIDTMHGCKTGLLISAQGIGGGTGLRVDIVSTFDALPGSDQFTVAETNSVWPCAVCAEFPGHVLEGLYKHDYEIQRRYEQGELKI